MAREKARLPDRTAGTVLTDEEKWAAVVARDRAFDNAFLYSVASTGIYCRPSCSARRAKRANVAFHETCADAEEAGFRACRRCNPKGSSADEQQSLRIIRACRLIEGAEEPPKLDDLAATVGLSPFHFHRLFKSMVGMTPKAYADAWRLRRVRGHLQTSRSVTEAVHEAGFNSSTRFYAAAGDLLGMTSKAFRAGGKDTEIRFAVGQCSLGAILVAQSPRGVCAILLGDDPDALVRELQDGFPNATLIGGDTSFEALVAEVVGFVEAPDTGLDLPLDIRGTAFQHRVWETLRKIPAGTTASYAEIAQRIGRPQAVRAVAQACAANKIAVAIPCHRVVRTDGSLSGYRWGVARKRALLAREAKR